MPPPAKPVVIGDSGVPFGANLRRVALPERVLPLPADGEVVADPEVALAVEHRLAAGAIAAAVELQRQHPGARREAQIRHVGHGEHRLARRDRVERLEQREQPLGLVPRSCARSICAAPSVSVGTVPSGAVAAAKSLVAGIGLHRASRSPTARRRGVAKFAIVGVCGPFSGSWIGPPQPPVARSTKLGTLPAAILQAERVARDRGRR